MSPLTDITMDALGLAIMLAVPAYFILQPLTLIKLDGGYRKAAMGPLWLAVPLGIWCTYAFADQSNLWPVPFILFAPFGTFYLIIIWAASRKPKPAAP